jgi:hypothetical protein
MQKSLLGIVCFVALSLSASITFAEENQPPAEQPAPPTESTASTTSPAPGSPDEVICKALQDEVTGTRVQHKRKICQTRREWQEQENTAQNTMQHLQEEGRFKNAPTPGNSDTNGH